MNINGSGGQGFMSEVGLDCQKIGTVLVKMSAKSMTERVTGNPFRPAESPFVFMDMPGNKKGINGAFRISLLWKKPTGWFVICKPVLCKNIQSIGR